MPITRHQLEVVDRCLDDARLWGLELDTDYRVLAGTFEPRPERHPTGDAEDLRLQVVLFPVGTIAASLRRHQRDGQVRVETFGVDQLVDVVDSFDGARVAAPLLAATDPQLESGPLGPELSLEGRSTAEEGHTHLLQVHLQGEGGRRLDLEASFDDLRVQDPAGEEIPISAFPR